MQRLNERATRLGFPLESTVRAKYTTPTTAAWLLDELYADAARTHYLATATALRAAGGTHATLAPFHRKLQELWQKRLESMRPTWPGDMTQEQWYNALESQVRYTILDGIFRAYYPETPPDPPSIRWKYLVPPLMESLPTNAKIFATIYQELRNQAAAEGLPGLRLLLWDDDGPTARLMHMAEGMSDDFDAIAASEARAVDTPVVHGGDKYNIGTPIAQTGVAVLSPRGALALGLVAPPNHDRIAVVIRDAAISVMSAGQLRDMHNRVPVVWSKGQRTDFQKLVTPALNHTAIEVVTRFWKLAQQLQRLDDFDNHARQGPPQLVAQHAAYAYAGLLMPDHPLWAVPLPPVVP